MLLPVQGSELPSCSSLFSQSSLPATSLGQVPLGARARALSALPICAPCSYAATHKLLFPLDFIAQLAPSVFQHPSFPAALPIPCPATAFCLSLEICQQLLFLPCWLRALSQSCLVPVPLPPRVLLIPPGSSLHPPFPLSGSTSLPLHLNQLQSSLSVLYYCASTDLEFK